MVKEIAIRVVEYEESLHRGALLEAIAQLQDHERAFDPHLLSGQVMAVDDLFPMIPVETLPTFPTCLWKLATALKGLCEVGKGCKELC